MRERERHRESQRDRDRDRERLSERERERKGWVGGWGAMARAFVERSWAVCVLGGRGSASV